MDKIQEKEVIRGPKNKKQIGEFGKGDKIYIEDYAVTYLNQIARDKETKDGIAGLFGTCREVNGIREYYIYGAVYEEDKDFFTNGLSRELVQKIMRQRAELFVEYFFLGWAFILKEPKGLLWENFYRSRLETVMGKPELIMTIHCTPREEHFYLYPTEMPKETEGYAIFYEKNDAMQNFLIDWHGSNQKDKCDAGDQVAENCRNYYKEKRAERLRTRLAGVALVATMLLMLFGAGVGIQNLNKYEKIQEAGQTIDMLTGDEISANGNIVVEETVLATEKGIVQDESFLLPMEDMETGTEVAASEEEGGTVWGDGSESAGKEENIMGSGDAGDKRAEGGIAEENGASKHTESGEGTVVGHETLTDEEKEGDKETLSDGEQGDDKETLSDGEQGDDKETLADGEEESDKETAGLSDDDAYVSYEVCKGDTLYGICVRFYGNLSRAQEICKINNIENKDNILYGEKILLPR